MFQEGGARREIKRTIVEILIWNLILIQNFNGLPTCQKKCIQSVLTLQLKSNLWNRKSLWNGIYASRNTSVGRLTLGSPLIFTVQCMVLSPVAPTLPKISNISLGNGTICKNAIGTGTCILYSSPNIEPFHEYPSSFLPFSKKSQWS